MVEGLADVDGLGLCAIHLDDGENEFVRLIERRENLIAGDGDGGGAFLSALDLDKAQAGAAIAPGFRDGGFDVIADVLGGYVTRPEAAFQFALGDGIHGGALNGSTVCAKEVAHIRATHEMVDKAQGDDQCAAHDDRRAGRNLLFLLQLRQTALHAGLQFIRPALGIVRIELGIGLTCGFLFLQIRRAQIPILNLAGQAILDGLAILSAIFCLWALTSL